MSEYGQLTSASSLFHSPAADITLEKLATLIAQAPPESLTLEFKERVTAELARSVAAMANTYGGLIVVGVADRGPGDRLIGVPASEALSVINSCHDTLEPPWEPEVIPVQLQPDGTSLLVIRVDASRAPRPILVKGAAPVRLSGRIATADRVRLAELFAESRVLQPPNVAVPAPQLSAATEDVNGVDLILRSGMFTPVGRSARWRPFSERAIDELAEALNRSTLNGSLMAWATHFSSSGGLNPFRRYGFNRARHARLEWQALQQGEPSVPIEAVASVDHIAGAEGNGGPISVQIDVRARLRRHGPNASVTQFPMTGAVGILPLLEMIDGLIQSRVDGRVVQAIADLANVEQELVPQPQVLHVVSLIPVIDLLYPARLAAIDQAGPSHGSNMYADPTRDLRDRRERHAQLRDWLVQLAMDSGLQGMEAVLATLPLSP